MNTIKFTKMNGAGNDFILIDAENNQDLKLTNTLIKKICDRRKGIGADGILYISSNSNYDFDLTYYNSDGFKGSLCGNGARCSIYYYLKNHSKDKIETQFSCEGLTYSGKKAGKNILFNFLSPTGLELSKSVKLNNENYLFDFINTGSPHAVIDWSEINKYNIKFADFNLADFGSKVRYAKEFQPEGTNVNIYEQVGNKVLIRTYERGVEEETLACGTGTVATALILSLKKDITPPITFISRDNDELLVNFVKNGEEFRKITLTGPAKINYIGSYNF